MAAATRYALSRLLGAGSFLSDNCLEPGKNSCVRSIRPTGPRRRNDLFTGSVDGGRIAAIAQPLNETAKMNGVESGVWLTLVLENLPDHRAISVDEFTQLISCTALPVEV